MAELACSCCSCCCCLRHGIDSAAAAAASSGAARAAVDQWLATRCCAGGCSRGPDKPASVTATCKHTRGRSEHACLSVLPSKPAAATQAKELSLPTVLLLRLKFKLKSELVVIGSHVDAQSRGSRQSPTGHYSFKQVYSGLTSPHRPAPASGVHTTVHRKTTTRRRHMLIAAALRRLGAAGDRGRDRGRIFLASRRVQAQPVRPAQQPAAIVAADHTMLV